MPDDNGITLAEAKMQLSKWLAADAAVSMGQSSKMEINGSSKQLTRADAEQIRQNVEYWNTMVRRLSGASCIRTYGVISPS